MSSQQLSGWNILSRETKAYKLQELVKLTDQVHRIIDQIKLSEEEEAMEVQSKSTIKCESNVQAKNDWGEWPETVASKRNVSWDISSGSKSQTKSAKPSKVDWPEAVSGWGESSVSKTDWNTGSEHDDSSDNEWADAWGTTKGPVDWPTETPKNEWGTIW